ncbi:MAG: DUF819 family protein [Pirellulales bacterium]|nr:DUF819 family protein [Pirellulales bacterium]
MQEPLIHSPTGILATLLGVTSLFLWMERRWRWRFFNYFPPLLFIYAAPMALSTSGVLANRSPVYDWMEDTVLPVFLVLMLLDVDLLAAGRVMGRGVLVFLAGTAGVVFGAPIAYAMVKGHLEPDTWKAFGILAGSWIGGAGNMAAVATGLELKQSDSSYTLAVLGDVVVYLLWIPILLSSKGFAGWFNRFTRVDPQRVKLLEEASADLLNKKGDFEMRHVLYLLFVGLACTWLATALAGYLPEVGAVLTTSSWRVLIITTLGLLLAMTPARRIPGNHQIAIAMVYLFVAKIGAGADVSRLAGQAHWFVLGALAWIGIHGTCCVAGARLLRVDVHSTAIASAANIGGIATASIVATHHNEKLVPVGILMALLGYALGNYGALMAAWLCEMVHAGW